MKKFVFLMLMFFSFIVFGCKSIENYKADFIGIQDTVTVNVRGRIIDLYDNFGLEYASIKIKNKANSYSQTCEKNGVFDFKNILKGKYEIKCNFVGYKTYKDSIIFVSGGIYKLKIPLDYDE